MEVGDKKDERQGQIPWGSRKGKQAKTSINSTPLFPNKYSIYLLCYTLTITFQMEAGQNGQEEDGGGGRTLN